MFIRSERLFLRPGWPEERAELHALLAEEAGTVAASGLPWPLDDSRMATSRRDRHAPRFLVTLPGADGARLIGGIGLSGGASPGGEDTELAFWIARRHAGQGFATEAGRAVIGLARALGYRRLVAHAASGLAASEHVLRKLGFRREGGGLRHALSLGGAGGNDGEPVMRAA